MRTEHDLQSVAAHFAISGLPADVAPVTTGHIHDTYILTVKTEPQIVRYVLQRINHHVFRNPPAMTANILRVTEHIRMKLSPYDPALARRQLMVVPTQDGAGYYRDAQGNYWRVYNFIENAVTYDTLTSDRQAREAARMFGWFQSLLLDLPGPQLHETIPGFHDTPRRLEVFRETLRKDAHHRAGNARPEIDFVLENAALCHVLADLVQRGEIPVRIAHNDAKINNVMLDESTGAGVCVIDLDTVMPGLSLYDFGDLARTAACPAAEDEQDLSQVSVDLSLFEALAQGFIAGAGGFLTPAERRHLVFAGKLITFEQLIRFLTDYLAGDIYYKTHRPEHNLDRSRTQRKLVQSITEQEEAMNELVERAFENASGPIT
jgi:hypothetical protein